MLSKVVSSSIFKVFGMTRPGIEPRSPGPLANTGPGLHIYIYTYIYIYIYIYIEREREREREAVITKILVCSTNASC